MLASELPEGRLVDASSIFELRLSPARLTRKVATVVDECWEQASGATARDPSQRAASA
jgi:hypothetical protein